MGRCGGLATSREGMKPKEFLVSDLPNKLTPAQKLLNKGADLCYYSPASGGYGIIRVVLCVPGSHALFVAPMGCGRHGVIASYYYKNTRERVHTMFLKEEEMVLGSHLDHVRKGALEIIERFGPTVLTIVYSCADDLLGSDYESVAQEVEAACGTKVRVAAMNPIRNEGKRPPLPRALESVYGFLDKRAVVGERTLLNVMGVFANMQPDCEIHDILGARGFYLKNINDCATYEEFLDLGKARVNLRMGDSAALACAHLKRALDIPELRWPLTVHPACASAGYEELGAYLGCAFEYRDARAREAEKIAALGGAHALDGARVAVSSSHSYAPLELARLVEEHGGHVEEVYATGISAQDEVHLPWLKEHAPHIRILPPEARTAVYLHERDLNLDLALGLEAAYYSATRTYTDLDFERLHYGFSGERTLLEEMCAPKRVTTSFEALLSKSSLVV